ncbi:MAG TPA: hypothetical protein VGD98_02170 [Ktedonobacteraceae bacterium]
MSNENEQSTNPWKDEDETEITERDAYLNTFNQPRRQANTGNIPQGTPEQSWYRARPRGVPGSAHSYEEVEDSERSTRPRSTRQSRAEVEARLRQQRGRQQPPLREQEEQRSRPPTRKQPPRVPPQAAQDRDYPSQRLDPAHQPRPTRDFSQEAPRTTRDFSESRTTRDFSREAPRTTRDFSRSRSQAGKKSKNDGDNEYDEIEIIEEIPPPRRPRRVFSTLLIGCLGGLVTLIVVAGVLVFLVLHNTPIGQGLGVGKSAFNQSSQQNLTLDGATQVIVRDQAGNIVVNVDQNASAATLTSVKYVQATGQSDANNQFKLIKLSITTITSATDSACLASSCLLISATTPTTNGGGIFGGSNGNLINLTVTLPASFNSPDIKSPPDIIAANASAGNITVSGFNGVLNLNGNGSNIVVMHTLIFAGTCIQTLHGSITISQESIFDLATPSKLIPCSNTPSSDPQRPWFNVKSGVGNVDITLTTNLNNLLLDANTNDGTITDDFNLNIQSSSGSATFHGPMIQNTSPTASLYVAASTGNITLHKK